MIITPLMLLFLVLVFVLLYLFLNTIDKRKWLSVLIGIVLTPFVYFFMFYPFLNIISPYHHQKYFNSKAWLANPGLRYEMIANTIATDTLIGATAPEVVKLLGPYEWLSWDSATQTHRDNQWNYGLGIAPGAFNTMAECFELTFINQKVSSVKHFEQPIRYKDYEEK